MRPQLIVDLGGRVLSALLVTPDGELVPCSQEIRNVATRHVSMDILFEPRVVEDRDFIWEDALEALAKTDARSFFQRARRIGLRRPWDPQASADALQLTSPLTVLSTPQARADSAMGGVLPRVALTMLDALLEPTFAFLLERQLDARDVDPIVILPAQTGRQARLVLQKIFRRRGFPAPFIVPREIAAAMAFAEKAPSQCVVIEMSETDLHLHRVAIDGDMHSRRFRTVGSVTMAGLGWNHWSARIAEALRMTPSAAFERALTALLTGSPDSLPVRITHGALDAALDEAWIAKHGMTREVAAQGEELPTIFAGEIFTIDAVRRAFVARTVPAIDHDLRHVAHAMRSRVVVAPSGTLRLNTLRGEAIELIAHTQLPGVGEGCHIETGFRLGGEGAEGQSFLVHLLWGADRVPEGNTTVSAMPVKASGANELRLSVHLRRSRAGRRLHGIVEARMPHGVVVARSQFTQELEVTR